MSQANRATLSNEGELKLAQFVRDALLRTDGNPGPEDSAAATEIARRYGIAKERAKAIVADTRTHWKQERATTAGQASAAVVQETLALMTEVVGVITNSLGMKFVWIPPGTFRMGSPPNEDRRRDDEIQHTVTLTKGFYMGVHAITQEQWKRIMGKNPSIRQGELNLPVDNVSWDDCQAFIERLREQDKTNYRLPSEAEWEYACRAGTSTAFHFGEWITTDQANYDGKSKFGHRLKLQDGKMVLVGHGEYREKPTPVGTFPANAWGLYDMHGNVSEWVHDIYGPYATQEAIDPRGPEAGEFRVVRSGSWLNIPEISRSAFRYRDHANSRNVARGFRLCFSLD